MKFFVVVLALFALAVAEPEPEADADPYVSYYSGGLYRPHAYGYAGYAPAAYGYGYGYGYPYAAGYHHLYKRDADAEPKADADADPYQFYSHGVAPYAYSHGVAPYAYGSYAYNPWGYGYARPYALAPTVVATPAIDAAAVKTVTRTVAVQPTAAVTYAHGPLLSAVAPKYVAATAGAKHVVYKRSADAEPTADADASADPYYGYYSGYHGYPAYRGYGYGHYPRAYGGYYGGSPYGYAYYG